MWLETFDFTVFCAVFICAIAIKMIDDFLDYDHDKAGKNYNSAEFLGKGSPVYAMLLFGIAVYLNPPLCLSLFLASYGIGMFHDLSVLFPSKLTGFQEFIFSFGVGVYLCGWNSMFFSFAFILAIQLIDDCIDAQIDQLSGRRNMAHHFGLFESYLLASISLLVSVWVDKDRFISVIIATTVFYGCLIWLQERRRHYA